MPKTTVQKVIFGLLMSFFMVLAMEMYNTGLRNGGLTNAGILNALRELPLMFALCFLTSTVVGEPLAARLAARLAAVSYTHLDVYKRQVQGSYEETFELSKQAIDRWGWYNRNAAINPYLSEGKKTVALEIMEQLSWQVPDYIAISVGDGCTIAGLWKGLKDLYAIGFIDRLPRLISAQAEGCCPINRAIAENKPWEPMEAVSYTHLYYTILFNGIADALKALDQQETSRAWDILVRIQQEAEDAYIRAEET